MEEILASSRRIIADDDAAKPAVKPVPLSPAPASARPAAMPPRNPVPPSPPPPRPAAVQMPLVQPPPAMMEPQDLGPESTDLGGPQPEDILELTEQMAAPDDADPPSFQTIDGRSDVFFADPQPAPEPAPPPSSPTAPRAEEPPRRAAAPPPPSAAADRGLISPSTSAAVDAAFNALAQTVLVHNARTLEDLVREMLRPMLKSWLDDNLPSMVERIVKAEIERVSRGR